jgi:hypothetical protein
MYLYLKSLASSQLSLTGDKGKPSISIPVGETKTVLIQEAVGNTVFCDSCAQFITHGHLEVRYQSPTGHSLTASEMEAVKNGTAFDLDDDGVVDASEAAVDALEIDRVLSIKKATIYVDGNRVDAYTEDGSEQRPYKTILAAVAVAVTGDVIVAAPKAAGYTETGTITLPASVSLLGFTGYKTKINSALVTGNAPCSLKDLEFPVTHVLTITNAVALRDCWTYGQVLLPNATSSVNAFNCYVTATGKHAVVMSDVAAEWRHLFGRVNTTGAFSAFLATRGKVIVNMVEVSNNDAAVPTIFSGAGSLQMFDSYVVNAGGGPAIDANNGATGGNPNIGSNVDSVGDVNFGSAVVIVNQPSMIPTSGNLERRFAEGSTVLAGATTVLSLNIPSNAKVVGAQFRVDDLVTSGDGGTSWGAAFSGGSVSVLAALAAFALNTKIDKMLTGEVVSALTQITFSCNGGTFSGGTIRAIVYYDELQGMRDA